MSRAQKRKLIDRAVSCYRAGIDAAESALGLCSLGTLYRNLRERGIPLRARPLPEHGTESRYQNLTKPCRKKCCRAAHAARQAAARKRRREREARCLDGLLATLPAGGYFQGVTL